MTKNSLAAWTFVAMWMIAGCGTYSVLGNCDRVTCSGHGTCQQNDGTASCACDPGWENDPGDALVCLEAEPESPIVDLITDVSEPSAGYVTVSLRDHQPVLLDMSMPHADTRAEILDSMRGLGHPMYFEIDLGSRVIVDYLFTLEGPVDNLVPREDGVEVMLLTSAAIHFLKRANPDFQRFLDFLEDTKEHGDAVLVTETRDGYEIIDVRAPLAPLAPQ
ncbi:MAG TPA: calcium-binding EGF-like domain-containing protein [Myxococcota bacterium]|nr:calcium-binding EGF-like domain-containing protein [Myxococcota bacterium]